MTGRFNRSADAPPPIPELERAVLEEVWAQQSPTARSVLTALERQGRPRAYTTVLTILQRLERRGLVSRRRAGKPAVYTASMSRSDYLQDRLNATVDELVRAYGDVVLARFARELAALDDQRRQAVERQAVERQALEPRGG